MSRARNSSSGFSLIEVIVALGILGGVLLSVAGLFLVGERQVSRGRQESTALTAAQTIVEEIGSWNHALTWERFGLAGTASAYSVDSRVNTFAAKWQTHLEQVLPPKPHAEIRLESCDGSDLNVTDAVRVVVRVTWEERGKERSSELAMVKM